MILVTRHTSSDIIDVTPAISKQATNENRAESDLLAVVVVYRCHVGQDLTAVKSNPVESRMGEVIPAVSCVSLPVVTEQQRVCVVSSAVMHMYSRVVP